MIMEKAERREARETLTEDRCPGGRRSSALWARIRETFMEGEPPSVLIKVSLGYDGTDFSGWAVQPGRRTVAGMLGEALGQVLRLPEPPELTVAGRTDAGVHARGQVAQFAMTASLWEAEQARLPRRLAAVLPPDLRVHTLEPAPPGFNARFSAIWRRYEYRVCDDLARADPLERHHTVWYGRRLDVAAMNAAAQLLLGEHDFAAFCRRREGATTIRALQHLEWRRDAAGIAIASVVADAFCHNMVRALMGAMMPVGEGREGTGWPAGVLAAGARDPRVRVMPPHGLCLMEVGYPPDGELAARAAGTRRLRTSGPAAGR
jgi:tRNA pseudouridine38-40 synthase